MRVVRHRLLRDTTGETFEVLLRGEGLDAFAKRAPGTLASTRLFSDTGASIRATLRDLRAVGDDEAEATIEVYDIESSGAYKGTFPVLAGSQGAQLNVEVAIQEWFWVAFGVVVLGVGLGWLLTHAAGVRRRKDVLRAWLIARIQDYETVADSRPGKPASFDLDPRIGPKPRYGPRVRCGPFPQDRTAQELLCRIAGARSEEDLKRDAEAVQRFIDAINAWLEVEQPARALQDRRESPPPGRGSREFIDTVVGGDTESLLAEAGDPPRDTDAALALARRLREQEVVWTLAVRLWELGRELEEQKSRLNAKQRRILAANDMDKIAPARAKPDESPTLRELRRLKMRIGRAVEQLERFRADLPPEKAEPEVDPVLDIPLREIFEKTGDVTYSMKGDVPTVARTGSGVVSLTLLVGARTALALTEGLGRDRRLLGSIWAGIRAAMHRLTGGAASIGSRLRNLVRRDRAPRGVLSVWTRRDVVLTLFAVAVSAAAYTLTVYDATWGTREDYLTAFAAGFLGKVVVDWGDQFISRSLRVD